MRLLQGQLGRATLILFDFSVRTTLRGLPTCNASLREAS